MFGVFLFLTYYLQAVQGFSPVASGLAFLPMIACVMISSNTSNPITLPRLGLRPVITIGMLLGCTALAYLSRISVDSSYVAHVLPALILMGFAMGMVMAPAMNAATAGVRLRPKDSGVAAALVSTMQQVGGSIGTAGLSTVVATATTNYTISHATGTANLAQVAETHGYSVAFTVSSGLFALGAVMGALLFPSKTRIAELRASAGTPTVANIPTQRTQEHAMADAVIAEG